MSFRSMNSCAMYARTSMGSVLSNAGSISTFRRILDECGAAISGGRNPFHHTRMSTPLHLFCDDWKSEDTFQWWCALSKHPEEYRKKIMDVLQHAHIDVICITSEWVGTLTYFPREFNRLLPEFHDAHRYGYIAYTHGLFPAPKEYRHINTMLKTSNLMSKDIQGPILLRRIRVVAEECILFIQKPLSLVRPSNDLQTKHKLEEYLGLHVMQTHHLASKSMS